MTKTIVLINGAPGSGKSTLAGRLREHLTLPLVEKDSIKEFYFGYIGVGDREYSRALGKASIQAMYSLAGQLLDIGDGVILESAFNADLSPGDIAKIVDGRDIRLLEVYCRVEDAERRRRFAKRAESSRHPGHLDMSAKDEAVMQAHFRPMNIGAIIEVDMTEHDEDRDAAVITQIRKFIKGDDDATN